MASDISFVKFVFDQAASSGTLTYKKMFGEYAVYLGGKVIAFICDNQLFVKVTKSGESILESCSYGYPYPGAKPHILIADELDDVELLAKLFIATERELPAPKPKRVKKPKAIKT